MKLDALLSASRLLPQKQVPITLVEAYLVSYTLVNSAVELAIVSSCIKFAVLLFVMASNN